MVKANVYCVRSVRMQDRPTGSVPKAAFPTPTPFPRDACTAMPGHPEFSAWPARVGMGSKPQQLMRSFGTPDCRATHSSDRSMPTLGA